MIKFKLSFLLVFLMSSQSFAAEQMDYGNAEVPCSAHGLYYNEQQDVEPRADYAAKFVEDVLNGEGAEAGAVD